MKIKRFMDKDSRGAMAQVRAEMGADAVILSNRRVGDQIELVAAKDFDQARVAQELAEADADAANATPVAPSSAENVSMMELQGELSRLRNMLESELQGRQWRETAQRPTVKSVLATRLSRLGLSRAIGDSIVDLLPETGELTALWRRTLGMLAKRIPVTVDGLVKDTGVIALVGSTGVGKTTTIAKLAAQQVLRHGRSQVALITTDCYRIGGQEQLQTFAGYLGVPMVVATDAAQLRAALAGFADRKLVLIDTAGMSQRDVRLFEQFATLAAAGREIDCYLVLSATAQPALLKEVIQSFGPDTLTGAIITKTDEATSLGGVLDAVIRNELDIAYVSDGQRVPEDIAPARVEQLVAKAIELMELEARWSNDNNMTGETTPAMAV